MNDIGVIGVGFVGSTVFKCLSRNQIHQCKHTRCVA